MSFPSADFLAGTTPRLRLRRLNSGDARLFVSLYTHQETMRHIAPALTPTAAARAFERRLANQGGNRLGQQLFVMEHRASCTPLGLCGTGQHDAKASQLEVGIMLLLEACAQGYGREAFAVMLERIFLGTAVQEIIARHACHAVASARLCRRQGFQPIPQASQKSGPSPIRTLSLKRADWACRARTPASSSTPDPTSRHAHPHQEKKMDGIITLLEKIGQSAAYRYGDTGELRVALEGADIEPALRDAVLARDASFLYSTLTGQILCGLIMPGKEDEDEGDEDEAPRRHEDE